MSDLMIWVCESCGDVWNLNRGVKPAHDHDGRPLCEQCRLFAAIPPSTLAAETVRVGGGVL